MSRRKQWVKATERAKIGTENGAQDKPTNLWGGGAMNTTDRVHGQSHWRSVEVVSCRLPCTRARTEACHEPGESSALQAKTARTFTITHSEREENRPRYYCGGGGLVGSQSEDNMSKTSWRCHGLLNCGHEKG